MSSVEPAFGSTAGGSTLVLTGAGFNETAEVWLGGVSAEVVSVGPAELIVESPPASAAGLVNVQVSTSAETATLDEARYWADATGEVSLVGGVVRFNQVGGYWSDGAAPPVRPRSSSPSSPETTRPGSSSRTRWTAAGAARPSSTP